MVRIDEEDAKKLDKYRKKIDMTRSTYLRFLLQTRRKP